MIVPTGGGWKSEAECGRMVKSGELRQQDADRIFFENGRPDAAQRICGRCPVVEHCRADADRLRIPYGVFAGEQGGKRRERLGISVGETVDLEEVA